MDRADIGAVLVFLGGILSLLESGFVVCSTGGMGAVGLMVAALLTAGAVTLYKSRFKLVGTVLIISSSAVGQLTGGAIGLLLWVLIAPRPWPILNETFLVSSWTLLALIGGILVLSSLRQKERK